MADRRLRRHAPSAATSGLLGRASPRAELATLVAGPVAELHAATAPPPDTRKRWRWLTTATH